ncbi:MAG: hypothetical protein AAGD10_12825 [Myxococcota bacterium]
MLRGWVMSGPDVHHRWRGLRTLGGGLALLAALMLLHGGWLASYWANSARDGYYTDDVRNLLGFFVYQTPEAFRQDDVVGAYSRAQSPFLHWALVAAFAKMGLLRELTQFGPPVLWVLTSLLAARVGAALGRWPGALLAATLVLCVPIYPERISGLLSRALCFPAVFWFAHGLVRDRPREAGAAVIVLAGFYPTVAAALGFGFAGWRLFATSSEPLRHRVRTVAIVGGLSVLLLVPTVFRLAEFGETTSPADWGQYPEAGPGGILGPNNLYPWRSVLHELNSVQSRLFDDGPWLEGPRQTLGGPLFEDTIFYLAFGLLGLSARRNPRARRFLLLGAAALFGHWVTRLFYPWMYVPTRSLTYVWPPFFLLAVVCGATELSRRLNVGLRRIGSWAAARDLFPSPRPMYRHGPWVLRWTVFGFVLAAMSGPGDARAGFVFQRPEEDLALGRFVAALPPSTLVAGLPSDDMSNLAWISGRQAFMTGEMHIPHHKGYLEQLRPRLYAFFDAYLAHEPGRIIAFAETYGVTHFLVDDRHFDEEPFGYMRPFGARVRSRYRQSRRRGGFALARLGPKATVAQHGDVRIVSVEKLRAVLNEAP